MPVTSTPPATGVPPIAPCSVAPNPPTCWTHDLLALVGLTAGGPRGLSVGQVLGRDVHPQPLCGEAAGGDVERVEETHQRVPIADWRIELREVAICVSSW